MAWQKVRIDIPDRFGPADREMIAAEIIEFIVERTRFEGRNKNNRPFTRYSKEYAKAKGVSRSDVDLTVSGEMLDELDIISHRKGSILIGYENGTESNDKATWAKASDNGPVRDFLGITKKAVREIVRDF